ncbi:MAG: hypothetical protein DRG78_06325 [Epsilonproteobacteria bacterium]|nr:MAG: hypothetical protein DRG78_06325 [Campylobacterota bacterium]
MTYKIFVSYSTYDLEHANSLKQHLEDTQIEVFIAEHSISPSQKLAPTISKAILDCDLFVVLWSDNAKDSDWVQQEIGKATAHSKNILPLVLKQDSNLPGFLQDLKYLNLKNKDSLSEARDIIIKSYNDKLSKFNKEQEVNTLAIFGLGAFALWAFSG